MTLRTYAPRHLGKAGRDFWNAVVKDFILDTHHFTLLENACLCLDRMRQARKILASEGLTVTDRYGQTKEHPMATTERSNSTLFMRLVREMGLDSIETESRAPRLYGSARG